jgi:HEAT repeat protein
MVRSLMAKTVDSSASDSQIPPVANNDANIAAAEPGSPVRAPFVLKAVVGLHYLAAAALLVMGYQLVNYFVDAFVISLLIVGWGWLLWRRVAWVRTATLALHTIALVVLVAGSLIAVPYLLYAHLGVAAAYLLVLVAWMWAVVAPVSGLLVWTLRRGRVRAQFTEPTPPLRVSLSSLFFLIAVFAVLSLGLFRQVQRDGVICVSDVFGLRFRIYSGSEMTERSIGRFIVAARRDDRRARAEAWEFIETSPDQPRWIDDLLTHDDSKVRRATLEQMSDLSLRPPGSPLRAAVLERLHDSDPRVRSAALDKLRHFLSPRSRDPAVMQAFQTAARDPSPAVRRKVLDSLVGSRFPLPGTFLAPLLSELSRDENPDSRLKAIDELGKLEFEAYRFLPDLMDATTDANLDVRLHAGVAAGRVGGRNPELVPLLTNALQDPTLAEQAASTLAKFGPQASDAVPPLLAAVDSDKPRVRDNAIRALGAIGPGAEAAIPKLIRLVDTRPTNEPYIGGPAITALGEIGPPARAAVSHLIEALQPHGKLLPDTYVPLALAKIAPDSPETLTELTEALNYHPGEKMNQVHGANMRLSAAQGLALLGPRAAPAQSELRGALSDENIHVRCHAAHALMQIDGNDAEHVRAWNATLDELRSLIDQGQYDAIWCAGALGPDAASLAVALVAQLSNSQPLPRSNSIGALAKVGAIDSASKTILKRLMSDPDQTVRRSAAEAAFEFESQGH